MKNIRWSTIRGHDRNTLPSILAEYWTRLDPADLPQAVRDAWTMAEWPQLHIDRDGWVMLFDRVDFIIDGKPADRAKDLPEIVTLYRGAIRSRRDGMSWTASREQAIWFARRFEGMDDGEPVGAWRIDIPREYVLAHFTNRGEDEYVVDTTSVEEDEYVEIDLDEEPTSGPEGSSVNLRDFNS